MNPGTAHEGCCGVTEVAIQAGLEVGRIGLGIFTNSSHPVMTGSTIVHDAGMIEHRADEGAGVMTDPTILVRYHMIG